MGKLVEGSSIRAQASINRGKKRGAFMKILVIWIDQVVNLYGGMEKIFSEFSSGMVNRGHDVTAVYCTEMNGNFVFPMDEKVKKINLIKLIKNHKFESAPKLLLFKMKREILRMVKRSQIREMNEKWRLVRLKEAIQCLLNKENPDVIVSFDPETTSAVQIVMGGGR